MEAFDGPIIFLGEHVGERAKESKSTRNGTRFYRASLSLPDELFNSESQSTVNPTGHHVQGGEQWVRCCSTRGSVSGYRTAGDYATDAPMGTQPASPSVPSSPSAPYLACFTPGVPARVCCAHRWLCRAPIRLTYLPASASSCHLIPVSEAAQTALLPAFLLS